MGKLEEVVLVAPLSIEHWVKNFREVTEMLSKIKGRPFTDEGMGTQAYKK